MYYYLYYYFNDKIKIEDFDFAIANLLCIRFDKVNGFFSACDGTRYLVLFDPKKYIIYKSIRCLISQETRIICFFLIIMQK